MTRLHYDSCMHETVGLIRAVHLHRALDPCCLNCTDPRNQLE